MDNLIEYKFKYEDDRIDFKNWEGEKIVSKNPSILFWLSKNDDCAQQFPNFTSNDNSIDFWFFCFRILSSYNCIKTDLPIYKYSNLINNLAIEFF